VGALDHDFRTGVIAHSRSTLGSSASYPPPVSYRRMRLLVADWRPDPNRDDAMDFAFIRLFFHAAR
jgi:hypothetical protein